METLTHRCWEWKQPQSFLKTIWHCLVKLNKYIPHKSAIPLPEYTPENLLCRSNRRFRQECSQQPHLEEQANKTLEKNQTESRNNSYPWREIGYIKCDIVIWWNTIPQQNEWTTGTHIYVDISRNNIGQKNQGTEKFIPNEVIFIKITQRHN